MFSQLIQHRMEQSNEDSWNPDQFFGAPSDDSERAWNQLIARKSDIPKMYGFLTAKQHEVSRCIQMKQSALVLPIAFVSNQEMNLPPS